MQNENRLSTVRRTDWKSLLTNSSHEHLQLGSQITEPISAGKVYYRQPPGEIYTRISIFFFSQNFKSSLQLFRDASYGAAIVAVNVSDPRTIPRQLAVSKFHCVFLESQDIDLGMVALGVILGLVASLFPLGL